MEGGAGFFSILGNELSEHAPATVAALVCAAFLTFLRAIVPPARRPNLRFTFGCLVAYVISIPLHAAQVAYGIFGARDWVDLPSSIVLGLAIVQVGSFLFFDVIGRGFGKVRILCTVTTAVADVVVILALFHHHGVELSAIFATSAVLTGVIGFALQETLGNVIGGVALQLESTFSVGDWLQVGDVTGQVQEIRWRSISLTTRNDDLVVIPNGLIAKGSFTNLSRPVPWHRQWVQFDVHYRHPPNEVTRIVLDALKGVPNVKQDAPAPDCIYYRMEQDHAHYAVRYRLTDLRSDDGTDSEVKKRIWYALRRHGIEIPYPSRNVFVTKLSAKREEAKWHKEHARRLASLRKVAIFAPLDAEGLDHLADRCRVEVYGAGETILTQGDPGDSLSLIRSGRVSVRVTADGITKEVAELSVGQLFGEMSLMTGEHRSATVVAREDTECYVIDRALFQDVLGGREELVHEISRILGERQTALAGELERLGVEAARSHAEKHADLVDRIKRFFGMK